MEKMCQLLLYKNNICPQCKAVGDLNFYEECHGKGNAPKSKLEFICKYNKSIDFGKERSDGNKICINCISKEINKKGETTVDGKKYDQAYLNIVDNLSL